MFNFIKKRYAFIMDEMDVTTVLEVINLACRYREACRVGNCGWADEPTRWFVMFHATEKEYNNIMKELMQIGSVNIEQRPGGQIDFVFRKDS